jgi:hypothetical protein
MVFIAGKIDSRVSSVLLMLTTQMWCRRTEENVKSSNLGPLALAELLKSLPA